MKDSLIRTLTESGFRQSQDTCLLAVSGGVDSMVLAELFRQCGLSFGIAHVNHGLRDKESDSDEAFVRNWAEKCTIPFYCLRIDLEKVARQSGLGYQEAGRNLRYQWFEELCREHSYRFIVTAHHADDQAETVLHRIIRGTGIAGLGGIPEQRGKVIRPLLAFAKKELMEYARAHSINWREDSSNQSEDYTRNQLRNTVLPLLEKLNPSVKQSLLALSDEASETYSFLSDQADAYWQEYASPFHGAYAIRKVRVHPGGHEALLLCLALRKLGFYPLTPKQLTGLMQSLPGKCLESDNLILYNDRESLYLVDQRSIPGEPGPIYISELFHELPEGWTFTTLSPPVNVYGNDGCAFFDVDSLRFPLVLRVWQQGDRIRPIGLNGSMKVSDILTQAKVPLFLKDRQWVLLSGEEIIWVPGFRVAAGACVQPETQRIVKICSPGL